MSYNDKFIGKDYKYSGTLPRVTKRTLFPDIDRTIRTLSYSNKAATLSLDLNKYPGEIDDILEYCRECCFTFSEKGDIKLDAPLFQHEGNKLHISVSIKPEANNENIVQLFPWRRSMIEREQIIKALSVLLERSPSDFEIFSFPTLSRLAEEAKSAMLPLLEHEEAVIARGGPPLPDVAPEFWLKRSDKRGEAPADFIERVYELWIGRGFSSSDLLRLDRPLYMALAKRTQRYGPAAKLQLDDHGAPTTRDPKHGWDQASREIPARDKAKPKIAGKARTEARPSRARAGTGTSTKIRKGPSR